ncbi:MAG: DUF1116 domain-containing protein [Nitrospinota bacterium]
MNEQRANLLKGPLRVINLGLDAFADSLRVQGADVVSVDWTPPAGGNPQLAAMLDNLKGCDKPNGRAVEAIVSAHPVWEDVGVAREVIPGMDDDTILHAGPPISWERMCGPMRGAVPGALMYERRARTPSGAERLARSGKVRLDSCHHHGAVGPMAGIISPRMPVFILRNTDRGNRSFATLNEGLGKVLRYGAYGGEVINRLRWMEKELAPALQAAVQEAGGVDVKAIIAKALHMGDECHNRNVAATATLLRTLAHHLARGVKRRAALERVTRFIAGNDHFFLNLAMPACKAAADAAHGVEGSSIVTAMARNGTDFGIRVSGLAGRWFTAPAGTVEGLYFPGFGPEDANPDIGDSTITETAGIGGFAMGTAPAIVQFVGGTVDRALSMTREMLEITWAQNPTLTLPCLNFAGTPSGIDIRKVVETGIAPAINTGIAHRLPGVGQVGAGLLRAPMEPFEAAVRALAEQASPVKT